MMGHDHINTEADYKHGDRSADLERRPTAGPTDVDPLKPESVSKCEACGERSAPHGLPDGGEICKCCLGVQRGDVTHREEHSRPLSTELERVSDRSKNTEATNLHKQ